MKTRMRTKLRFHQPRLESLEQRLPPGDALWGLLFGLPELESRPHFVASSDANADSSLALLDAESVVIPELTMSRPLSENTRVRTPSAPASTATQDCSQPLAAPDTNSARLTTASTQTYRAAAAQDSTSSMLTSPLHVLPNATSFAGASGHANSVAGLAVPPTPKTDSAQRGANFGKTTLTFEENVGQTDSRVDFIARTNGYTAFITPTGPVFSIANADRPRPGVQVPATPETADTVGGVAIHMQVVGGNPEAVPTAVNRQLGIVNHFIGNDPNQWRVNIPTFGGVQYDDIYPGIDVEYYGTNGQLEYDFIVLPGAEPNTITLNFAGADGLNIDQHGDLILHTAAGDVVQQMPYTYQTVGGVRWEIPSAYVIDGTQVRFEVGAYDATRPLVIDPLVMGYSTFMGGPGFDIDEAYGIAVDDVGNAYVTGATFSSNFPDTPGAFDNAPNGGWDAFVAKLNADGSGLTYATYLGGSADENFYRWGAIAVDAGGNAHVTGYTASSDFPTTSGAFDTAPNGGWDAFVTKLSADGSALAYSTYLGGSGAERG